MIVALAQFGGINNRFTEGRWNRMNNGVETGRKFLETLPHRFAADESRIGQSCHVARDLFLQRLKPKLTLPRRAAGKEFVKNYEEAATTTLAKGTQDWQ